MQLWNKINYFLSYYRQSQTIYQVHSPFVFDFVEQVLEDDRRYYSFVQLENFRQLLLQSSKEIEVTDFGAGSHKMGTKRRKVKDIAKYSVSPPRQARFLFRLANHFKPNTILELGTSLGLSALYLSSARKNARIITLEGCPQTAQLAQTHLERFEAKNIEIKTGPFEQTYIPALQALKSVDLLFIDGNHQEKATIEYFEKSLPFLHDQSIVVFDDIYWSEGMKKAWEKIKAHPKVTLSIDLYETGLVLFRQEQKSKEHFTLITKWWKPWRFM